MLRNSPARPRRFGLAFLVVLAAAAFGAAPAAASSMTLYVSPGGSDAGSCSSASPCKTIGHAVSVAMAGDRIVVRRGTYHEGVIVKTSLHLVGRHHPVIDATGQTNGIVLAGPGTMGASVRGFTVENANQEGIIALNTSWVTIEENLVQNNDLGMFAKTPTGECAAVGQIPGDCGEGIHLMTVNHAQVIGNRVTGNSGGVLLTDEFGPTFRNVLAWNHIWRNQFDCGITMPGHSPNALSTTGVLQPSKGGVYMNLVVHNVVNFNGLKGEGAGILMAAAGPGSASYDNIISHNTAIGNNLAGVTIHSHAPNQDVNGNSIIANTLRHNNRGGDPDAAVTKTADVLVFSAVSPITGTVVRGNWLSDAFFGVWTLNAHATLAHNHFHDVHTHVHQG